MNAPRLAPRADPRRALARSRAISARAALAECRFCNHDCGVNRFAGPFGRCHAGAENRCFSAQVEVGDELELIPTFAIAFGGCDMRCDFCITGAESWNSHSGELVQPESLARKAQRALTNGARTVMFLGGEPTIHLPAALEIAAAMPAEAKLVWKTNAHGSRQAREFLDGIFDVWLADNASAWELSSEGRWMKLRPKKGDRGKPSQAVLMRSARARAARQAAALRRSR